MSERDPNSNVVWDITSFDANAGQAETKLETYDTSPTAMPNRPTEAISPVMTEEMPKMAADEDGDYNWLYGENQENYPTSKDWPTQSMPHEGAELGDFGWYGGDDGANLPPEGHAAAEQPEPRKSKKKVILSAAAAITALGVWAGVSLSGDKPSETVQANIEPDNSGHKVATKQKPLKSQPAESPKPKVTEKAASDRPTASDKPSKKPKHSKSPSPAKTSSAPPAVEPEPTAVPSQSPAEETSPSPTETSPTTTPTGSDEEPGKKSQKTCVAKMPMEFKVNQKTMFGLYEHSVEDLTPVFADYNLGGAVLMNEIPDDGVESFKAAQNVVPFIGDMAYYHSREYYSGYEDVVENFGSDNTRVPYRYGLYQQGKYDKHSPAVRSFKGVKFALINQEDDYALDEAFVEAWRHGADVAVTPKYYEADDLADQVEEIEETALEKVAEGDLKAGNIDKSMLKIFKAKDVDACGLNLEAETSSINTATEND